MHPPCDSAPSGTFVWSDLVLICESLWTRLDVTLDAMIASQSNLPRSVTLDNMLTLGGMMMHVLLHLFKSKSLAIAKFKS